MSGTADGARPGTASASPVTGGPESVAGGPGPGIHVGLIWAQDRAGAIGAAGRIPWRVPEDLVHFKAVTLGRPVVMGRRTWDSLPPRARPLPGRVNIVVTGQADWAAGLAGATRDAAAAGTLRVAHGLPEALALAGRVTRADAVGTTGMEPDVWVMGGARLYADALPLPQTRVIERTLVDVDVRVGDPVQGIAPAVPDAFAPGLDPTWRRVTGDDAWRVSRTGVRHRFERLVR